MNPEAAHRLRKLLGPIIGSTLRYRRSMESVAKHFRTLGFYPNTVFDVGVYHGTYELYNVWPKARLILVDPLNECEEAMRYICAHRAAPATHIVAAAGDHDGEAKIGSLDDLAGASIVSDSGQRSVPMYTLDSLDIMLKGVAPYLLKIDVQGAETLVLSGASRILPSCEVVMLETQLFDFAKTGNTLPEVIALMKSKGFVPFEIYDGLCRPLDRSLGQIDVAFVKTCGRFRQSHEWGTKQQSRNRAWISRLRRSIGI